MHPAETPIYHIIILAAVVICSVLVYCFVTVLRLQAKYRQRYKKEIEAEINSLETERKIISVNLHDDLAPVLLAAKMHLLAMKGLTDEAQEVVNKALLYIENMNSRIRGIVSGLMLPPVLFDRGPVEAAEQFIDAYSLDKKQQICISGYLPPLTEDAALHLYRIMQEIIINTCKHADARRLEIIVMVEKKQLLLATADDGSGFDADNTLLQKQGFGLANIQSRVLALNGILHISSSRGKGTRYCITIPLAGICKTTDGCNKRQ